VSVVDAVGEAAQSVGEPVSTGYDGDVHPAGADDPLLDLVSRLGLHEGAGVVNGDLLLVGRVGGLRPG
jgi:hypothetical protein